MKLFQTIRKPVNRPIHRPIRTAVAVLAVAAVPAGAVAVPTLAGASTTAATSTTAAATNCPRGWGSLPESGKYRGAGVLTNVRTGRHACFDRLVVDVRGRAPGYDVRYVSNVTQDGSGFVVPLRGGAKLEVVVRAPA